MHSTVRRVHLLKTHKKIQLLKLKKQIPVQPTNIQTRTQRTQTSAIGHSVALNTLVGLKTLHPYKVLADFSQNFLSCHVYRHNVRMMFTLKHNVLGRGNKGIT